MINISLLESLDRHFENFDPIPETRKYWLIRTQGGKYFESFLSFNYVALGHNEISYSKIVEIKTHAGSKESIVIKQLKELCEEIYDEEARPGLIASQIYRFVFELKKGDIVIIPSENSEEIAIGKVTETPVLNINAFDLEKTECPFIKRKSVKWEIRQSRQELDPYLFRLLQAHQAINDISYLGDTVERTMGNFYIKGDYGNLVLNVAKNDGINAMDLFQMGYHLLKFSENYFKNNELPFDINDFEVKINLNSKGKIQFKSLNAKAIWLLAIIVIAINGGGLKFNANGINFDLSTDGLIKNIIEYKNSQHDRIMTDTIIKSIDSLKIQSPDDAVKVFQQFNTNKK
jgi:hypothetical protein